MHITTLVCAHLPQRAKEDLLAGAHVCRHSDGGTAVPADQFGDIYQAKERFWKYDGHFKES